MNLRSIPQKASLSKKIIEFLKKEMEIEMDANIPI